MAEPLLLPILHHFALSPYAEKIRLILGAKGIAWRSVVVPMILPKPDLLPLTGGYRRTPVLQIGADVFCDTTLIARVLDRLAPHPPLYAESPLVSGAIAQWAERDLFSAAMAWSFQPAGADLFFAGRTQAQRQAFFEDRRLLREGGAVTRLNAGDAATLLHLSLHRLAQQLADGRAYLLGPSPCIADFCAYAPLWTVVNLPPVAGILDTYPPIRDWLERLRVLGQGPAPAVIDAQAALDVAQQSEPLVDFGPAVGAAIEPPVTTSGAATPGPSDFAIGSRLTVMPNDYGFDAVEGEVVFCGPDHVALRRDDPRAGRVVVHFPRHGYTIRAPRPA